MQPSRGRALPIAVVLLLGAGPPAADSVLAWTKGTDERVVREALRLMPESMRSVLTPHLDELVAGTREAAAEEPSSVHAQNPQQTPPSSGSRLEDLVPKAVAAIDQHKPFAEVARLLGRIAHYAGDLNNPLQVAADDPDESRYAAQYSVYVEQNLKKYPLVFYGWEDQSLDPSRTAREGLRAFAEATASRARASYAPIRAAYATDGPKSKVPLARRFDERSLPFGVGSLSWSRTVTDTARLWRHVWKHAHGDMAGTPYVTPDTPAIADKAPR
ncbi:MAG: hypothetical protein ACREAA_18695 [Candidatus Polarisedimenticolia bacterium]